MAYGSRSSSTSAHYKCPPRWICISDIHGGSAIRLGPLLEVDEVVQVASLRCDGNLRLHVHVHTNSGCVYMYSANVWVYIAGGIGDSAVLTVSLLRGIALLRGFTLMRRKQETCGIRVFTEMKAQLVLSK